MPLFKVIVHVVLEHEEYIDAEFEEAAVALAKYQPSLDLLYDGTEVDRDVVSVSLVE